MQRKRGRHLQEGTRTNFLVKVIWFIKNYLAAIIAIVAFFIHFFLPIKEPEVVAAQMRKDAAYDLLLAQKDSLILLSTNFRINRKGRDQYFEAFDILQGKISRSEADFSKLDKIYERVKAEHKVFGYSSRHKFMWSLGLGIIISLAAIRIFSYTPRLEDRDEQWSNSFFGIAIGTFGGYFFSWIFYPDEELPYGYYISIIVTLGLLASIGGFFATRYISRKQQNVNLLKTMLMASRKLNKKNAE